MGDRNIVDVPGGSCKLDRLARAVVMVGIAVAFDTTLAVQHEHALRVGTFERVFVGFWCGLYVAVAKVNVCSR